MKYLYKIFRNADHCNYGHQASMEVYKTSIKINVHEQSCVTKPTTYRRIYRRALINKIRKAMDEQDEKKAWELVQSEFQAQRRSRLEED